METCLYVYCEKPGTKKLMIDEQTPIWFCKKHHPIVCKLLLKQIAREL